MNNEIYEKSDGSFGVMLDNWNIGVRSAIPNPTPKEIIDKKYEHAKIALMSI